MFFGLFSLSNWVEGEYIKFKIEIELLNKEQIIVYINLEFKSIVRVIDRDLESNWYVGIF